MKDMQSPIIVIVGPTAVGKTALALALAKNRPAEIVSADSRQIYRLMDIGTAKPSQQELAAVPHHFIDFLDPATDYNAGQFMQQARQVIAEIQKRNRLPIVVGGSGLYVRALLEGFFETPSSDSELRRKLQRELQEKGAESMHRRLLQVDPELANKTHPRNVRRIIRALEVYQILGEPISEIQRREKNPATFSYVKFGLRCAREELYRRIEERVDRMMTAGLVQEVQFILDKGYLPDLNALNSVGYKEIIAFLQGECSLEEAVEMIKRNTRRFAKRQLTWFRTEEDIHWIDVEAAAEIRVAAEKILRMAFRYTGS